jgi:hypothetical protein
MRFLAVKLALLAAFLLVLPVGAQSTIHLTSVSVDLWPEYDQPAVLVIYHIQLAGEVTLPASLTVQVPASAQINAVATDDPAKGLINAPYQSAIQGDWTTLTITANSSKVQVEYYVSLQKDGSARHITYEWPATEPVDTLDVNFLLPAAANQLKITPSPVTSAPGQGGLTNYLIRAANLPVGKPFTVAIEYQRQTDELSIASLPVQAVSTPGSNTPGLALSTGTWQWVLGGVGVLLIAGGIFGFFRWRRGSQVPASRHRHGSSGESSEEPAVYCSECGNRAQPGDVFCRTCGAKLRQIQSE